MSAPGWLEDPFAPGFGGGSGAALSVAQLSQHLAGLIREDVILQDVWVRGEISNCTRAASGHLYLSLKDDQACLNCVMWRSAARRLPFVPESGMQVLAHGLVDVYVPRGQYQLVVDELQPDGQGALFLALEQTRARLAAEGLLDPARKRPLPGFPRRVAVVTSLSGAAVRDICVVLGRGPHPPDIVLVPAQVQGEGAAASLCRGLRLAGESSGADLIIVGRGGGSLEDLWTFNMETVARAIAASPLPVISAVGHEVDFTLADLAADWRAPTPTAAAEHVVALRADQRERWQAAVSATRSLFRSHARQARLRWQALRGRAPLARPEWMVESRRQRLDDASGRLSRAWELCLFRWQQRLAVTAGRLEGLSPLATLARGYASVTQLPEGSPVTRTAQVGVGSMIRVRFCDGCLDAQVSVVDSERGSDD